MVVLVEEPQRQGVISDDGEQPFGFLAGDGVLGDDPSPHVHRRLELRQPGELRLEPFLVKRVTLDDVLLQNTGSPDAKFGSAPGVNAVSNGQDGIQTVEGYRLVRSRNVHFLHIAFFL